MKTKGMCVGVACLAVVLVWSGALRIAPANTATVPAPTVEVPPDLLKARLAAAEKAYKLQWDRRDRGLAVDIETLYIWSRRWMDAQQAISDKPEDRLAALRTHLDRIKKIEDAAKARQRVEPAAAADVAAAEYYRAEAEVWLAVLAKAK